MTVPCIRCKAETSARDLKVLTLGNQRGGGLQIFMCPDCQTNLNKVIFEWINNGASDVKPHGKS